MTLKSEAAAIDPRVAENSDHTKLASHLINTARDHLAGRDHDGQHLIDVRPQEHVVLGVLLPQPPVRDTATAVAATIPTEPGVSADHLPASEMGLSVLIEPTDGSDTLRVNVSAEFAMYLQHTPTHAEQAERSGLDAAPGADLDTEEVVDNDHIVDGGAIELGRALGQSSLPLPPEPSAQDLAHTDAETAAAILQTVRGALAATAGQTLPAGPTASAGKGDFFRQVYKRYDVTVEHELQIALPSDARPRSAMEQNSYDLAVTAAVATGFPAATGQNAGALFNPMQGRSAMRIPRKVVQDGPEEYETFLRTNARPGWKLPLPAISFRLTVQRTPDNRFRLSLTLVNDTARPDRDKGFLPEVAIYDAGFRASISGAKVLPSEYRVIERDYRTQPLVYAHGRFCCLDEDVFHATGELATTTLPIHRQMVYESKPELEPTFTELATQPIETLERIEQHMLDFASLWDSYLTSGSLTTPSAITECEGDRKAFLGELSRFRRGLQLIRDDLASGANGIGVAFIRANEAFALMNTRGGLDSPIGTTATTWRLFQIVFVVANLGALAAREASEADKAAWRYSRTDPSAARAPSDLDELAIADVLWFPTGGGKSAALYGIVAVGLFYDRLRGKHRGVSSVIRFPLRMLSVQQLERVLRLVAACEIVRSAHQDPGDPFRLGYWVGKGNTPNKLTDPMDDRWHDLKWMARQNADWKRENTVLPSCPFCGGSNVTLDPDPVTVTLAHRCNNCGKVLPVDVSDDEVYRNLPAVLVGTVDKIAALAFNSHASHLTHGATHRCPDHGYITHPQGRDKRCLARDQCSRNSSEWQHVDMKDPAPALVIQDELHLLSEELGTFAAHYETLWQHLCTAGSGLPSKILAATATISDYENQVSQLYALTPRRFPTDGWIDGDSFYANRRDNLVRRLYVGALPNQMDVVQFALAASDTIRQELTRLGGLPPTEAIKVLDLTATNTGQVPELLFQYELQCFYCNRKAHADRAHSHSDKQGRTTLPGFQSERLNGQTKLADISEVIRRVEREDLSVPAKERLGVLAGTSLISHGVDLERLNVLFVLGMPSTISYYVQASSRAGRTGVGIVFTALAKHFARDRSVFHFFDVQHRYVNVLVEPVALNRFSVHGPKKTASGVLAALLIQKWGRDIQLLATAGMTAPADLTRADPVRLLLLAMRRAAEAGTGQDPIDRAQADARSAFGLASPILDPHIASMFADRVDRETKALLASIEAAHEGFLTRSLRPPPPTSLRDVDESADFGASDFSARRRFDFLGGNDDDTDYSIAEETD